MHRLIWIIVICLILPATSFAADSLKTRNNVIKINPTSVLLPLHTAEISYERLIGQKFGIEAGGGYVPFQYSTVVSGIPRTSKGYKLFISPRIYLHEIGKMRTYVAPMFTYHYLIRTGFIYGLGGSWYANSDYYQIPDIEYDVYEFALKAGAQGTGRIVLDFYLGLGFSSIEETVHIKKAYTEQRVFSPTKEPLMKVPQLYRFPYKIGIWMGYTF